MKEKRKQTCCECGHLMERCKPVVQHQDGTVNYCCPRCWRELEYHVYLPEE